MPAASIHVFCKLSLIVTETKILNLRNSGFIKLDRDQFSVLLHLCENNLEKMIFKEYESRFLLMNNFLEYTFPKLIELDFYYYGDNLISLINFIRCHPNLQILRCRFGIRENLEFPPDINFEKLERLELEVHYPASISDSLRSLSGRVPNLKHFKAALIDVSNEIVDDFIAFVPNLQTLNLDIAPEYFLFQAPNLWNLSSLTSLALKLECMKET